MTLKDDEPIDDLHVFLPMIKPGSFVGMYSFQTSQKFNFAFTSTEKMKEFIRLGRDLNLFHSIGSTFLAFPCTIKEYMEMKERDPHLPLLAIDPDPNPEVLQNIFVGDSGKENVKVARIKKDNLLEIYLVKKEPKS